MKRYSVTGGWFFIFLWGFCCGKGSYNETLSKMAEQFLSTDSVQYTQLIVIPATGCTGCISKAERYFLQHVEDGNIKFIFTEIISKKALTLRFKKGQLQKSNVYLDHGNLFCLSGFEERIYPHRLILQNNKVLHVQRLDEAKDND